VCQTKAANREAISNGFICSPWQELAIRKKYLRIAEVPQSVYEREFANTVPKKKHRLGVKASTTERSVIAPARIHDIDKRGFDLFHRRC
jgi:hypothetical protein